MAELTREQHEQLAGSWSNDPYFGSFNPLLDGLFVPSKGATEPGNVHYSQMVNLLDGIARRLTATCGIYVYKDSTDEALEFSVRGGSLDLGGVIRTYLGEVNLGPLTAEQDNYIWLDFSASGTLSVGLGSEWPTTPHLPLALIAAPAAGHWLPQHLMRVVGFTSAVPRGRRMHCIEVPFAFDSTSPLSVGAVPAGARVISRRVIVEVAFDGTTPEIEIGRDGDADELMNSADSDLTTPADYELREPTVFYEDEEELIATLALDGASQGEGVILVEYRA